MHTSPKAAGGPARAPRRPCSQRTAAPRLPSRWSRPRGAVPDARGWKGKLPICSRSSAGTSSASAVVTGFPSSMQGRARCPPSRTHAAYQNRARGLEPTAVEPQPTTEEPQPTNVELQLPTEEPQRTAVEAQPTTEEAQPTTEEPQPTAEEPQPTTEKPQPTAVELQSAAVAPPSLGQAPQPTDPALQPPTGRLRKKKCSGVKSKKAHGVAGGVRAPCR
jgi:hypothetical protein